MKLSLKKIASAVAVTAALVFSGVGVLGVPAYAAPTCDSNTPEISSAEDLEQITNGTCKACIASSYATGGKWEDARTKCIGDTSGIGGVWTMAKDVINWILIAASIIAVGFIIWAGIRYVTSGGDAEKVKKAKNTLLYAIIGLLIAALAMVIVNLVLNIGGEVTTTSPEE